MSLFKHFNFLTLSISLVIPCSILGQSIDNKFQGQVKEPSYTGNGPKILVDEAHYNLSNDDSYDPLFKLLMSDGYRIDFTSDDISKSSLQGATAMIIINPRGGKYMDKDAVIFSKAECSDLINWIKGGGALLLIIDNFYSSSASKSLTNMLGIKVGGGVVTDSKNYEKTTMRRENIVFAQNNGLINNHPIVNGRNKNESIASVTSFSGTSINTEFKYSNILEFTEHAKESKPDSTWTTGKGLFKQTYVRFIDPVSVAGLSQGVAFELGKGRVVVLGDGTMVTALITEDQKQGMNAPENDNQKFALNIMRWLSRKL